MGSCWSKPSDVHQGVRENMVVPSSNGNAEKQASVAAPAGVFNDEEPSSSNKAAATASPEADADEVEDDPAPSAAVVDSQNYRGVDEPASSASLNIDGQHKQTSYDGSQENKIGVTKLSQQLKGINSISFSSNNGNTTAETGHKDQPQSGNQQQLDAHGGDGAAAATGEEELDAQQQLHSKGQPPQPEDQFQQLLDAHGGDVAAAATGEKGVLMREVCQAHLQMLRDNNVKPDTGFLGNLAELLYVQGRVDEAVPLFRQAANQSRKEFGNDHKKTFCAISNLAEALNGQGKLEESEKLYREVLDSQRRVLGEKHPDTLKSMGHYAIASAGLLLAQGGTLEEAQSVMQVALEVQQQELGPDDPATLNTLASVASVISLRGKLDEAEPLYQQLLKAKRKQLGNLHPDTLTSVCNLGSFYVQQEQLVKAQPLLLEVVDGRRQLLGNRHVQTLDAIHSLGSCYLDQTNYDKAEPLLLEALEGYRQQHGKYADQTVSVLRQLGMMYVHQGQLDKAEPMQLEALEGTCQRLGPRHEVTMKSVYALARLYQNHGQMDKADPLMCDFLDWSRKEKGSDHPDTLKAMAHLGAQYKAQGRNSKAWQLLKEAQDGFLQHNASSSTSKHEVAIAMSAQISKLSGLAYWASDPRSQKDPKQLWSEYGGEELEEAIRSGAIRLLKGKWIADFVCQQGGFDADTILPCRQQIPEEAFATLDEIIASTTKDGIHIIAVSHMWLVPSHPDPRATTLKRLANQCRTELRFNTCFVFFDFASLLQHPDPTNGVFRTPEENELFYKGLDSLAMLFSHPHVTTWKITKLPPGYPENYDVPPKANNVPYYDRGWTFAEDAMSNLVKSSELLMDITAASDMLKRRPPLTPDQIKDKLATLSFTNAKDDRPLVAKLYKNEFERRLGSMVSMFQIGLFWGDDEIQQVAHVIGTGHMPALKELDLRSNPFGPRGCERLSKALKTANLRLEMIDFSSTKIGEAGVVILADYLVLTSEVRMRRLALGVAGCQALNAAFVAAGPSGNLRKLYLDKNETIGDDGVEAIAGLIVGGGTVEEIGLMDCGVGDKGCHALAKAASELDKDVPLRRIDIGQNPAITNEGCLYLRDVLAKCPNLEVLSLDEHLKQANRMQLIEVVKNPRFEINSIGK